MTLTVVFAHGLEGHPEGRKPTALRQAGLTVVAPDGRGMSFSERIAGIEAALLRHPDAVLVGSSYGGLAALAVAHGRSVAGLVLLAPALHWREPPVDDPGRLCVPAGVPAVVVHGLHDEVVPVEVSRALVARCPHVRLHTPEDAHALRGSLPLVVQVVAELAARR